MTDPNDDAEHCGQCGPTYDDIGEPDYDDMECVCCECCCECMACIYAPRESVPLTEEQRAPIAAVNLATHTKEN